MLGPGLGYKTTFFILTPPHHLPVLSHAFMQHKAHLNQSGLTKTAMTVLNAKQYQSDAFTPFLVRSKSSLGLPPPFHTALNATRIHPIIIKMTVLYGRSVAGVSPLTMHTTTVPLLIMDAS
jgi:hypothetical protein